MNLIDDFRKKIKMQLIFFRKLFVISDKKMIDWRWQIPEDAEKTVDGRILAVNFVMDDMKFGIAFSGKKVRVKTK